MYTLPQQLMELVTQRLIYGFLNEKGADWAVNCGCAHGALAMPPGDTTMATFDEVQRIMKGGGARVQR